MSEEIRVGVFVCDCGSNIASVVNVPELVEYSKELNNVVFADEGRWSCSVDYLAKMQDYIKEHNLNRVVIASCTARTHEPLFKKTVKEAGLNPYLLEFVSIREQVSWVHKSEPIKATVKAKELVKMGVAKACLLEAGEEIQLPVQSDCLVIGGGIAGMTAALNVAGQGFSAFLVEKKHELGGILNKLSTIAYGDVEVAASEIVREKTKQVNDHERIKIFTDTTIEEIKGYIGNYKVSVRTNGVVETFQASTVIAATGMKEVEPGKEFGYGENPRVVTQLQLEEMLINSQIGEPKNVVIINCVNSKNETRGCCTIGCHVALKNALAIKIINQDANVHILYRDLSLVKEEGKEQEKARKAGIRFIRFPDESYPEVSHGDGGIKVKVYDILLGKEFSIPADLLVLTSAFEGDSTVEQIKGQLKVSANAEGFFQEAHVKLGPLDFPSDGVSLCGCASSPKNVKDTLEEAIGAAMRVSIPMRNGYIEAEGIVADLDLNGCNKCGLCARNCPYNAILLNENKEPNVIKALCKGCGLCAADCPKNVIKIVHFGTGQIMAQIEAALEEEPEKKIIGFVCHWCALGGVDMAGVSRLQYPTNARLIRVMCAASVSISFVERAFELGAAGVLVAGCEFPTCHYITGNYACEKRMKLAAKRLEKKGHDPSKLWTIWCSAADGPKFVATMRDMVKQLNLA